MTSIGRRCRCGNTHSRAVLIARLLSGATPQDNTRPRQTTPPRRCRQDFRALSDRLRRRCSVSDDRSSFDNSTDYRATAFGRVLFHLTKVVIAQGLHLFPSRTEKLNLAAPMILRKWESRSPPPSEPRGTKPRGFFLHGRAAIMGRNRRKKSCYDRCRGCRDADVRLVELSEALI